MPKGSSPFMNNCHNPKDGRAHQKTRIAIMGATSHIAKGLISNFLRDEQVSLHLFARNSAPVHAFLRDTAPEGGNAPVVCEGYEGFGQNSYDAVINCVGLGTVSKEPHIYTSFFMVTEDFDNLIISYLTGSPDTLCINFSSGAVYGRDFSEPAHEDTSHKICVNALTRDDFFSIAKLNSEAKHRAFENLNIIDIRVFSYFSRFVDLTGRYFITELLDSIIHNKVFHTSDVNIVRDYIHPHDLYALVRYCLKLKKANMALDAYSLQPVEKTEILEFFSSQYNLKYVIDKTSDYKNVTGHKNIYYSLDRKARELGYEPGFSSMDTIRQEASYILLRQPAVSGPEAG